MIASEPQSRLTTLIKLYESEQFSTLEIESLKFLEIYPQSYVVENLLGISLQLQGKLEESVEAYSRAIRLKPDYAEAYSNRGIVFKKRGLINEALLSYDKAIEIKTDYAEAYYNRGNIYKNLNKLDQAVKDYKLAIYYKADYVDAYYNLANVYKELGSYRHAILNYASVLKLSPKHYNAYCNRANVYKELGQFDKALDNYEQAIELKPDNTDAFSNLCYTLNYLPDITLQAVLDKHTEYALRYERLTHPVVSRKLNQRLRVGYISPDFHTHSVAYFFSPLVKFHNTTEIEVYCYHNSAIIDRTTADLKSTVENWRSIYTMDDKKVVELIKKDNIDILVDLAGHTANNRLPVFAYKPAPVQISWLGYPNTTGLDSIDYRFTDEVADPLGDSDRYYSEKLIRLNAGFLCYQGDESIVNELDHEKEYVTFGSFNNLSKLNDIVIKTWSTILNKTPKSNLILKSKQLIDSELKDRYLEQFKKAGIANKRIQLYGQIPNRDEHLKLYNKIDICLDSFPYNGTTTTFEALWMGVPVICLLGRSHAARVGASILTHMGLTECLADSEEEYIKIAIELAADKKRLRQLHSGLREQLKRSPLMDGKGFAAKLENEYRKIWATWCMENSAIDRIKANIIPPSLPSDF